MQVRVLYLGMLKEIAGREHDHVQLADGAKLGELYSQLQQRVPDLGRFTGSIALAVNYEYADPSAELHEDDEIALIPPVSGGFDKSAIPPAEVLVAQHSRITWDVIDTAAIAREIRQPEDGAVATFDGIVRNHSRGRRTLYLDYTAYEPMALRQMEQLALQALGSFGVRDVRVVHRLGRLQIGETSVFIAVASAHRAASFEACHWIIDTLKKTVPIWKKEYFEDGAVWADGEPFPPEIATPTR